MFKKLKQWRDSRNINGYDHKVQVSNIVEEVFELMLKPKDKSIENFKNDFMEYLYADENSETDKIDAYCDLIVFSVNAIELLGYDAEKCMNETIKEISSRKQNPTQKEIWKKFGASGKWEKDKEQDTSTIYQADYESCKL